MNQKNNDNLIGYDPLAWLEQAQPTEDANQSKFEAPLAPEVSATTKISEPTAELNAAEMLSEDVATIMLGATQNLQNIAELYEKLLQALDQSSGVITIDASKVQSVDTATLQLFVALKQETRRVNRDLQFDFPSEKFLEACSLLGLLTILDIDKLPAGLF